MNSDFSYFATQSAWGVTKHFGGVRATDELAARCCISKGQHILEVGCGVGVSTCRLAHHYACRVTGVDLSERMLEWAGKRVKRKSLEGLVQLKHADAQALPFDENTFDAVICESVIAFVLDKKQAVSEYTRVVKPGGCVGMNEGTWAKENPPAELVDYIERGMEHAKFLAADDGKDLLESAHLTEISVKLYTMHMLSQRLNEMSGLDFQDTLERFKAIGTFIKMLGKPDYRKYFKTLVPSGKTIKDLFSYLGYGLYVGKKPSS